MQRALRIPLESRSIRGDRRPASSGAAGVHAIILSAGQGRRLMPLTADTPKCLLRVGERSILEWEIEALLAAGIRSCTVVVGFRADKIVRALARFRHSGSRIRTLFNPAFDAADNLISCWAARSEMNSDFLLLNGDTLFEPLVVERVLSSDPAPITVAVRTKRHYDADDMKVSSTHGVLRRIGKELSHEETDAESIGMLLFRQQGPRLFREALEELAQGPRATRQWYLSVIDQLAQMSIVRTQPVDGLRWAEIDFPGDLKVAAQIVSGWTSLSPHRAA